MLLYKHQLYNEHCNNGVEGIWKEKEAFQQNDKDEKLRTELKEMERDDNKEKYLTTAGKVFNTHVPTSLQEPESTAVWGQFDSLVGELDYSQFLALDDILVLVQFCKIWVFLPVLHQVLRVC